MKPRSCLLLPLLLWPAWYSWAGKKDSNPLPLDIGQPAASASDIPALADLLARAGWDPTPEMSGTFKVGAIFIATEKGHRPFIRDCFDAPPTESTYTQAELITQMQAGVRVRVGRAGEIGGHAGIIKQVKFGTPLHTTIDLGMLVPSDECRQRLSSSQWDLSKMYAVQEVLSALITEQTCGRVDAKGRFVLVGSADAEATMACAQESMEPVAVAYRVVSVLELVGKTLETKANTTTTPSRAQELLSDVDDITATLRKAEVLKQQLARTREQGLTDACSTLKNEATDVWSRLSELRRLGGADAQKKVEQFVSLYEKEQCTFKDIEGTWTRALTIAELGQAREWLKKAKTPSPTTTTSKTVTTTPKTTTTTPQTSSTKTSTKPSSSKSSGLVCGDIMNMVNVNVPIPLVVQTVKDSSGTYDSSTLDCLMRQGAPKDVLDTVRARLSSTSAPVTSTASLLDDILSTPSTTTPQEPTTPEHVKEAIKLLKAKKPLTSSLMLFDELQDNKDASHESQLNYYLARSLYDIGLPSAAQHYFIEVLRKGPQDSYFAYALPKLVSIAQQTGDDSELLRIVTKIPPESFPRSAQNALYYLMGLRLYEESDRTRALKYFGQISTKSEYYGRSRYFEGIIYNQQGKLKSAVRSFRDVITGDVELGSEADLPLHQRTVDLSLINIGRIYFSIQRFDTALGYYDKVPKESEVYWRAMLEAAWCDFYLGKRDTALTRIANIEAAERAQKRGKKDPPAPFLPEARVLKALINFDACDYGAAEAILLDFEKTHRPIYQEMKGFVQGYATPEGKKLADKAWEKYLGANQSTSSSLTSPLMTHLTRDQDLVGINNRIASMAREATLIDEQKSRWKDVVGVHTKQILAEDIQKTKRRGGLLLLSEMARTTSHLGDLLAQSEIIRFEIVDATQAGYKYKNPGCK